MQSSALPSDHRPQPRPSRLPFRTLVSLPTRSIPANSSHSELRRRAPSWLPPPPPPAPKAHSYEDGRSRKRKINDRLLQEDFDSRDSIYGSAVPDSASYIFLTFSMWFLVTSWRFGPFLFNPMGFEWQKIVEDWDDWAKWINSRGGIGVPANKSWESWWDEEQEHLQYSGALGQFWEIFLSMRFFIYQYGIVYHLNVARNEKSIMVYGLSWLVIVAVMIILKIVSMGRKKFSADFQLMFRLLKLFLFIGSIVTLGILFTVLSLTIGDIFASLLTFMPTGWAILQISQSLRPLVKALGFWGSVKALARGYEYMMGLVLFGPISILAWFPFVSEFQTRLPFKRV